VKSVIAAIITALALFGCGRSDSQEQTEAENFVKGYCSILQRVYAEARLEMLANVATEQEYKKVFPVVQALKATNNVMKTEVLEFKVKGATVQGTKATVRTSERWRFWWEDRKSGAITKPKVEESYDLEYSLLKLKGSWRVDSIRNLNQ
jgi:hypothetical protein